jgi:hypothetical protein
MGSSLGARTSDERTSDLGLTLERMTGIEPALSAWEADVLPLNYIRRSRFSSPGEHLRCPCAHIVQEQMACLGAVGVGRRHLSAPGSARSHPDAPCLDPVAPGV